MSDKDKIGLSRRRILGGLGAIGAASVGAGMGTSAYFNDTETFEDNTITAGSLDLSVTATGHADQDGMGPEHGDFYSETSENGGMVGTGFEITDLKPGDTYDFCWCISNSGNPAVVRAFIPWDNVERGNTSTEEDAADLPGVDSVQDFENPLGSEHITVSKNLYLCGPGGVDKEENILVEDITYEPSDPGGWDTDGGLGTWVSSLSDNPYSRQDGVPIGSHDSGGTRNPGENEEPLSAGTSDYILIGENSGSHFSALAYCMTIEVSEEAGNELQNGWAEFDLQFLAEQARHNDHPFDDKATRPRTDNPTDWTNYPV